MANKLVKIISEMDYDDLLLLQKDLKAGNIERLIKRELKERKNSRLTSCPVCGGAIKEGEGLHLEFGPPGLRKKATFDGADCMQYFIEHKLKSKKIVQH